MSIKPLYELYNIPCKEFDEVKNINKKIDITKKKQKISDEEMKIPCKNTLYYFETTNYSSSQLRLIAKYYKLKLSGKKIDIINRIKNYLLIDSYWPK